MSFRTKLLLVVLLTIFTSVSVVAYAVTHYTQAAFEAMDAERTEALVAQFKKEFVQRGAEIAQQAKNIAEANFTERMAIDMSRPNADLSLYVRDAIGSAQEHGLDYVEFVNYDGVLISSAQFRACVCSSFFVWRKDRCGAIRTIRARRRAVAEAAAARGSND